MCGDLRIPRAAARLLAPWQWFWNVITSAALRFYWDDCFSRAAALSYTTLFALVPLTALVFSMFGVFGLTTDQLSLTLRTILEQVLPPMKNSQLQEMQAQVLDHLEQFSLNVRALNTVSIAALIFTSVALLNTIESALNVVWRVTSVFSLSKIASFWTVVTLGPLFIALSIYWTTRVRLLGLADEGSVAYSITISLVVPVIVTALGLTLLFYKLPAAKVALRDALVGAIVSALLFEFVKRSFAYYVGLSTTYSTIYGVVATIPLFLFWLYVAWCVVLYGAEISYQSGSLYILKGLRRYATDLGEIGALLGLRILCVVGRNFLHGNPPPTEGEIAIETGSDPVLVRTCLDILCQAGLLSVPDEKSHARSLTVAPERISITDILRVFRSKEDRQKAARGVVEREKSLLIDLLVKAARHTDPGGDPGKWSLLQLVQTDSEMTT